MNSKFTDKQIKVYAEAFRVGDAIRAGGKWHEVVENRGNNDNRLVAYVDGNNYIINDGKDKEYYLEYPQTFKKFKFNKNSYQVTTLKDYNFQGGEKIVYLGNRGINDNGVIDLTFGKVYTVNKSTGYSPVLIIDDSGDMVNILSGYFSNAGEWGVIPRYEQVANDNSKEEESYSLQDLIQINADLIPDAKDLITGRNEVLSEVSLLLKQTKHSIELASQECKSTAKVEFLTTVANYKAKKIMEITEGILKNKGYTIVSKLTTELEEGYSSIEYISIIKLVINW